MGIRVAILFAMAMAAASCDSGKPQNVAVLVGCWTGVGHDEPASFELHRQTASGDYAGRLTGLWSAAFDGEPKRFGTDVITMARDGSWMTLEPSPETVDWLRKTDPGQPVGQRTGRPRTGDDAESDVNFRFLGDRSVDETHTYIFTRDGDSLTISFVGSSRFDGWLNTPFEGSRTLCP